MAPPQTQAPAPAASGDSDLFGGIKKMLGGLLGPLGKLFGVGSGDSGTPGDNKEGGGLLGGLGKMFSGKGAVGALLGVMVGLLFGFDDPMWLMGIALIGALATSGVAGDMFNGVKNMFGGKGDNHQQPAQQQQVAHGPSQNQQQAQQQAAQVNGPQMEPVCVSEARPQHFMPYAYDPIHHKGL